MGEMVRDEQPAVAMRRRAVFLDRDGTITRYTEYCRRPEDLRLLPGAGAAIRALNLAGFVVAVVTNQSAIGRGWLTHEQLEAIHAKMRRALRRLGARVDAIYVCPHRPDDGCACRKPHPGLLQRAARELGVSLADSYAIGDRYLDVRSGQAVGSRAILVRSGHAAEAADGVAPDFDAPHLNDAVAWILAREQNATDSP